MTHWTPNGGRVAECGENIEGEDKLAIAAMGGVNCSVCREMVMLKIDSVRFGQPKPQAERYGVVES